MGESVRTFAFPVAKLPASRLRGRVWDPLCGSGPSEGHLGAIEQPASMLLVRIRATRNVRNPCDDLTQRKSSKIVN